MPAKPLTREQKEDAARLKEAFRAWQNAQRDKGAPVSQLEAAARLGFGQSALSQYLNGQIPLNGPVLAKFCELIGTNAEDISPTIVAQEAKRSRAWTMPERGLQMIALEVFALRGIKAGIPPKKEAVPEWLRGAAGPTYLPDIKLEFPDGSIAWVEVKAPSASGVAAHLAKLQAEHPRDFLLLMAHAPDIPRIAERWMEQRDRSSGVHPAAKTERIPVRNVRHVWVVGMGQGGWPERIWTDGDYPVGATDEYAEAATTDDHAFVTRVVGDSMVPRYMPGEYALVEPGTSPELEDTVLVRLKSGETMFKRLLSRRGGVRLGSYNSSEVMTFREDEITWMYYVAHPIPSRRIKHRIDVETYHGLDRRSRDEPIDEERRDPSDPPTREQLLNPQPPATKRRGQVQ